MIHSTIKFIKRRTLFKNFQASKFNRTKSSPCLYHFQKQSLTTISGLSKNEDDSTSKAILEAERVTGYRSSYFELKTLLSNEIVAIAAHIKKLSALKHPLLSTARGILFESEHSVQARGLIILLLSKLMVQEVQKKTGAVKENKRQQSLAELTELIHIGFLIHRGIVDRRYLQQQSTSLSAMEQGNKISVLSGDYLFAKACVALSQLQNSKVVSLMSTAIGDMSQGYFVLPESSNYSHINDLDCLPCSLSEWENLSYLAHGSLLDNACRSSAELLGEAKRYDGVCSTIGKNIALAQQARVEIESMRGNCIKEMTSPISLELCALPVVLAAEERGGKDWLKKFVIKNNNKYTLNKTKLMMEMNDRFSAFAKAEAICKSYSQSALNALENFSNGEIRTALNNLINAFSS